MKLFIDKALSGLLININMLARAKSSETSFLNTPINCHTIQVDKMPENEWYRTYKVSSRYIKT